MKLQLHTTSRVGPSREEASALRTASLAGRFAPLLFAVITVLLTWDNLAYLEAYGWRSGNHHGVPWPSALALGAHGWVMMLTFAVTGVLVLVFGIGLRCALPATRSGRLASRAVLVLGAAMSLSAFPVNRPRDPADVLSWCTTWHGRIHLAAFVLTILASLAASVATAIATRGVLAWQEYSRLSAGVAAVLAVTLILPSSWAWGWYLFLATLLGWLAAVATRLERSAIG